MRYTPFYNHFYMEKHCTMVYFSLRKGKANPKRFLTYRDFYLHKITNVAIGYDKKSLEICYLCTITAEVTLSRSKFVLIKLMYLLCTQ